MYSINESERIDFKKENKIFPKQDGVEIGNLFAIWLLQKSTIGTNTNSRLIVHFRRITQIYPFPFLK